MSRIACACCVLGVLVAPLAWAIDCEHYEVTEDPGSVQLSIADGADSRGFAWHASTNVTAAAVWLLRGEHDAADDALFDGEGVRYEATVHQHRNSKRWLSRFQAKAYGLDVGETYSYRLGCAGHYAYGTFVVSDVEKGVTIVNFNDVQTKDATKFHFWESTCQAALQAVGGADRIDLIVDGGDRMDGYLYNCGVNSATNEYWFTQWGIATDAAAPFFPGVPWVCASGNHDYRVAYDCQAEDFQYSNAVGKSINKKDNEEQFDGKEGFVEGCHSFDFGNVHVATLPYARLWGGADTNTMRWLERDLRRTRSRGRTAWTVVVSHAGPYTTGDHIRNTVVTNMVMRFSSICAKYGVDLVLQAHDHVYTKTLPYRWGAAGYTKVENDDDVVNLVPTEVELEGETYDLDPNGTYYVCCGCAGHRFGSAGKYADRDGSESYTQRIFKVATGRVKVDSAYARKGADGSKDVGRPMFGVLRVRGDRLGYDYYAVNDDGTPELFDTIRVCKTTASGTHAGRVDFSELPAGATVLNPLANDRGETEVGGEPITDRYWSFLGDRLEGLVLKTEETRRLAMACGADTLYRNFSALSSLDPLAAEARQVAISDATSTAFDAKVRFTVAPAPPEIDKGVSDDKLSVFVLETGGAPRLCALAGFCAAVDGTVEPRLFVFDKPLSSAWLAADHRLTVRALANVTADGNHPGFLVSVDDEPLAVAAAQAGYLGEVEVISEFAAEASAGRLLLGLKTGAKGRSLRAMGFRGWGEVDEIALRTSSPGPQRNGLLIIVR